MAEMTFAEAIDTALGHAMARDERVITFGEDVHLLRRNLYVRFGESRVRPAPISESAFLGAAVGAAMAGLIPVVEIMMIDFIAVAFDAVLNQASKVEAFSGGRWKVPMVIRSSCGGGYGDAGQHEQCLWGTLGGVPGIKVAVPSNPADAAGLMLSSIADGGPVVFLEHKLLSDYWLDYLGAGNRDTVFFDVPPEGARGEVPDPPVPVPLGRASVAREGGDLAILSLGVGLHRSLKAARHLRDRGIDATVIDLRTPAPLDNETLLEAAACTGRVLVVDEDYAAFGLSGEIAAVICESEPGVRFARVATRQTIPYARKMEQAVLPGVGSIVEAAIGLFGE